jgi:putative ABC transport system permease protein
MMNVSYDIRYSLRNMRRSPGFTFIAIATLALGIGATTSIFTVVNMVFFHPLPVKDPAHLVSIFTTDQHNRGGLNNYLLVSYPNGEDIQHRIQSLSGMALYADSQVSMSIDGHPESLHAQLVSGNFFNLLGVEAALGRTFTSDEDKEPGKTPVIVLDHGFWERKFAGNSSVIGKSVLLNGHGFTVIGVAPLGFQGPSILAGADMWIPLSMHDQIFSGLQKTYFNERRFLGFFAVGRLRPTVSLDQALVELQTLGSILEREFPLPNKGRNFTLLPLLESTVNPNQRGLFTRAGALMMTAAGLILLIGCANIANLLLLRAAARRREISLRIALGASRSRIIIQLLTEAVILATAGGVLGLGIAVIGRKMLWQFRPPFLQQATLDLSFDVRVLLFALLTTLCTAFIFGLAPALKASRPDLVSELKERNEAALGRRFGLRNAFVVLEFALSLVALAGAGLFLISLRNAQQMDLGFDTKKLAMVSFDLGALDYSPTRTKEFQRRLVETVQSIPAVKSVSLTTAFPLLNAGFVRSVFPEGQGEDPSRNGVLVGIGTVAIDYFQTMDIPLVSGQSFDASVREDSPRVAIINQSAAYRFWSHGEPVGKRFKFYGSSDWIEVIGVARDSKYSTVGEDPRPYIYLPLIQNPASAVTLIFRTRIEPEDVMTAVRNRAQALDPNLLLTNAWPVHAVISQALWGARFGAGLLMLFAGLGVLLCAIGIYGVMGYSVKQQAREIGIRMALGARRQNILLMVLRQSASLMAIGLSMGLISSFLLARLIINLLYGAVINTPGAFVVTSLMLLGVGLLASYLPARQAAAADPLVALRNN